MLRIALVCAATVLFPSVTYALTTVKQQIADYGPSASELGNGRLLAEIYDSAMRTNLTFTEAQAMAQHPMFHITPPSGWMNDPNGMFQLGALYHVFYQWNPAAAIWGAPFWGHVVSSDLAHWQTLPPALVPDTPYDAQGVFSGSATVVSGTPILLFTGVNNFTQYDYYYQTQAMATPTVPASTPDPLLIHWTKSAANPIIPSVPQGGNHSQFRDPMTAWEQGGTFYSAIGGQLDCSGSAMLYSSKDFASWSYEGLLASQPGIEPASECSAASNGRNCDQFGKGCHSWECPDYFAVPGLEGAYALKWSDQVLGRVPFGADYYVIGESPLVLYSAASNSVTSGLFQGNYNEASYIPKLLDYGSVYASKSFRASDGRQLMMSWIFETSVGCDQMCSSGTPFTNASNWQGAQSIPRDITYDAELNELVFYPIVEIEGLRGQQLYKGNASSSTGALINAAPFLNTSNDGRMLDILVNTTLSAPGKSSGNDTFMTGVRLSHDTNTYTDVLLNGTITQANSSTWVVESLGVYVDRRMTGGATNTTYQGGFEGGPVSVPAGGLSLEAGLQLRVLVDHSLLEVFANNGRGRISSRIYPLAEDHWGVSLGGGSSANSTITSEAVIYAMDSCWVESI